MDQQRQLSTPIVLIIFKRPDTTQAVFDVIRQARPKTLFVIADGPRSDRPGEPEDCQTARAIIDHVDWDCEVFKNYSEANLGCARRVSSGLDWVFNQVEEAIILEDDCVPHPTFFGFCEELLNRYRYDTRIMSISGQNVQFGKRRTEYSYYFSRYHHCWGWATWRRAWQYFDFDMELWDEVQRHHLLNDVLPDAQTVKTWTKTFQDTQKGLVNSWANRWMFACWLQSGISILANHNLVSNIGFGQDGTHTLGKGSKHDSIPAEPMDLPLSHPPFVIRDTQADQFTQTTLYSLSLLQRIQYKTAKLLNGFP